MLIIFITAFISFIFSPFLSAGESSTRVVLVSVVPYKYFVEKVVGDTVEVLTMVPAGMSPHVYEPTARRVMKTTSADLWFTIGEAFESKALAALQHHRSNFEVVDLRQGIDIDDDDLHIWLSPRLAKIQATTIAEALSRRYPELKTLFAANLQIFHAELDHLHGEINAFLTPLKQRYLVISHPAYGYFCREYGLEQIGIERDSITPSPWRLDRLLKRIQGLSIRHLFSVRGHSDKAVRLIAEKIDATVVVLDPLAENYVSNLWETARLIRFSHANDY